MVEKYHELAKTLDRNDFVKAIKQWWREEVGMEPPASQYLYTWYDRNGY